MTRAVFLGLLLLVCAAGVPGAMAAAEYETILRIATHAHEEIKLQLAGTDDVPASVETLFQDGAGELDALKAAIENDDAESAERHFLATMDIFKKIPHMISGGDIRHADAGIEPDLKSVLERSERFITKLKNIAVTHGIDADFSQLDGLLGLAQQQVGRGDGEGAVASIAEINALLPDIESKLEESSQQRASDRAKTFAQQYVDTLDKIIADAEELGYYSIVDKLESAKEKLSQSSDPRLIIDEIKQVLSIKEQLDLSQFEVMLSRAVQIDRDLDVLQSIDGVDYEATLAAKKMIDELRAHIDEGSYDEAQSLLTILEDHLDDILNPGMDN